MDPRSPPLSRFRIVPPPALRPKLFPDEARFALRLSILVGCTELAAWAWFARAGARGALLGWATARLLWPVWALLGTRLPRTAVAVAALLLGAMGVPELHDRGTPRSAWSVDAYLTVLRKPFGWQIVVLAFFGAFLALQPITRGLPGWLALLLPLAGMAIAARVEPHMPNAVMLPRIALGIAALGLFAWFLQPLRLLAMGAFFAAIPA